MTEDTWKSRKQQAREKFYREMVSDQNPMADDPPSRPVTRGNVPSPAASPAAPSAMATAPASPSSGTSATATAKSTAPSAPLASSTPAESTKSSSDSTTVWTGSPLGYSGQTLKPIIVDTNGLLVPGLSSRTLASLQALATARSEPVDGVIQQIADFFVEEEDERAEWPLGDALDFYVNNFMGGAV